MRDVAYDTILVFSKGDDVAIFVHPERTKEIRS